MSLARRIRFLRTRRGSGEWPAQSTLTLCVSNMRLLGHIGCRSHHRNYESIYTARKGVNRVHSLPQGSIGSNSVRCNGGRVRGFSSHIDHSVSGGRRGSKGEPLPVFSFSGAGWLTPFHLGAANVLIKNGFIGPSSRMAGASGGAICVAGLASNVSPVTMLEEMKILALRCQKEGTTELVVREVLNETLPDNAHELATGKIWISVRRLWPPETLFIEDFTTKAELIDAIIVSSWVPFYLSRRLAVRFRGALHIDGGIPDIVPAPVDNAVKVCPYPSALLRRDDIAISPTVLVKGARHSILDLLRWTFIPGEVEILDDLFDVGEEAARDWMATQKVV